VSCVTHAVPVPALQVHDEVVGLRGDQVSGDGYGRRACEPEV